MWGQIRAWIRREGEQRHRAEIVHLVPELVPPVPERAQFRDWKLAMQYQHQSTDWVFIPYKTIEEFDAAVSLHRARIMDVSPSPLPAALPEPCLPPPEAARKFLDWLRKEGRCGSYSDAALKTAYAEHCAAMGLSPSSESHMRRNLATLGGVEKRLSKGSNRARRERPTVWIISPSLAEVVEAKRLAA